MERWLCGVLADYRGVLGEGCIGVDEDAGIITGVRREAPPSVGIRDYRGRGYIIAPGFIDLHVHLRGLGLSYKEDEESGCLAAASSGITLVVDMPNTSPPLVTPEALDSKLEALDSRCIVDHGVYAGVPREPRIVVELAQRPIAGFKVFPGDLYSEAIHSITKTKKLVILHPELPEASKADLSSSTPQGREAHRGCWWESAAVHLIARIKPVGRIHVTHASCPSTVEEARRRGFTVDVTPHHLFYDTSSAWDPCLHKVNPPLRPPAARGGILKLLMEGRVDALASDHAPHAPWEKVAPPQCPPGFPWLEAWPWLVRRLVAAGALSVGEFHWLLSRGPALILGLRDYGTLERGGRANIVVYDPRRKWRFPGPRHSKARLYPAFMAELVGAPVEVIVGGSTVYLEGEVMPGGPSINPFSRKSSRVQGAR